MVLMIPMYTHAHGSIGFTGSVANETCEVAVGHKAQESDCDFSEIVNKNRISHIKNVVDKRWNRAEFRKIDRLGYLSINYR